MNAQNFFETNIQDFYRKAGRETLPWRKKPITAYEVWVSEVMLQQTQVARVIDYYEKFLRRFPDVFALSQASWEEFLPYYAGLGYYRRGRNMLVTAQRIVQDFEGVFPRNKKLLMSLPGIGDYTASAILSFAYGENERAWDTNLKRVIGRYFFGSKHTAEDFLKAVALTTHATILNAALMDFGSTLCLARPKCNACSLAQHCVYLKEKGQQENVSQKKKKEKKMKKNNWREARVFVWLHRDHTMYYSSRKSRFEVFVVPQAYNTRNGIKTYFRERYGVELSVRPPHKKAVLGKVATLFVNAQILLGEPRLATFPKETVKRYNEDIMCKYPV